MFYCPYVNITNCPYRAMVMNSHIRILHAAPNAPAVDVYANGNLIAGDITYKELTPYLAVPPGNYNIMVYPSGQTTNPVVNTTVSIPKNSKFTVAAIGTLPNISLQLIPEPITAQNSGDACVRFVHLSPNAPAVDIKSPDGKTIFSNVAYKNFTLYACIPPGTYTFNVTPTGTNNVVLTVPNVKVNANNFYSIYAVGLVGESPPLEAILVPEPR
jgi:hypothetical protein